MQSPFGKLLSPLGLAMLAALSTGCRPSDGDRKASAPGDHPARTTAGDRGIASSEVPAAAPAALVSEPLAPPAGGPDGGTRDGSSVPLFEAMDAAAIGVDFLHAWKPQGAYEEKLLRTGFTGGGCALGDYDGDGLLDLFLTRPYGGARLFRNLGGFRFEDVTAAAGIEDARKFATGAAFADVDNDGDLDLYLCRHDWYNSLYRNNGDGTFTDIARDSGLQFIGATVKIAFADYDLDGDLDAYLVTNRLEPMVEREPRWIGEPGRYRPAPEFEELVGVIDLPDGGQQFVKAGQRDRLFRNNLAESGTLTFTDTSHEAGLSGSYHGLDVIWCDPDGDGHPDLYVCNDFTDPDQLLRNNRDGTFTDVTAEALPHLPWFSMAACSEDFDGDLLLDLLAADMAATTHFREKMSMGAMDAVAWFLDTAEPRQYMRNALFLNSGTPRFREAAFLAGLARSNWTWSLKPADYDLDGRIDVLATNGFTRDYMHSDFAASLAERGLQGDAAAWLDAPELREQNLAFRNEGALRFADASEAWGLAGTPDISFGAAVGDLDGDGDPDLVIARFGQHPAFFRNTSSSPARLEIRLRGTRSNRHGIGALVTVESASARQIRALHPGTGFMSSDAPALSFGIGQDPEVERLTVAWPSGATQTFTDLAPGFRYSISEPMDDGKAGDPAAGADPVPTEPLFAKSDALSAAMHRETPFDDFERQLLLPNRLSQLGPGLALGDIDGNGTLVLFLGGAAGQSGIFLVRQTDGNAWAAAPEIAPLAAHAACEDMGSLLLDVDADGDLDLFVVSGGIECEPGDDVLRDRLYLNETSDGEIRFIHAPDALPDRRESGGPVAAADYDRDGDLDLFIGGRTIPGAYPLAPPSRLLRNDGGTFTDVTEEVAPSALDLGMVTSALWTDVDDDGWIDLLVTIEYGAPRILRNESGSVLRDVTDGSGLADLSGWWNSVVACDFDLDGDMDYALGNLGLNTKYRPSPAKPQLLFYGDFEGTGAASHIVEAKSSPDGIILPTRGRSCSSTAMPFLREKFPTYETFASARLDEIYESTRLESAVRRAAGIAESGMLVNDGTGRFAFAPFPRIAQLAPVFGICVLDANQDRWPDLFLAQNFFSPQRETGRMNGGLGQILLGGEGGTWIPLRPDSAGIVMPHDATAAVAADLDGDGLDDLIVAQNDGPVHAFLRRPSQAPSSDAPRPARITLQGPPGNRQAVGARVRIELGDDQVLVSEVAAGSGYLTGFAHLHSVPRFDSDGEAPVTIRWPDGTTTEEMIAPAATSTFTSP